MNFRDLLYFSKGERRALTVLLCLIVTAWLILLLTDEPPPPQISPSQPPVYSAQDSSRKNFSREKKEFLSREIGFSSERNYKRTEKKKQYPQTSFPKNEKYPVGTVVELNTADTTILKKVPGIGSTFAKRIVRYRDLLGGFYSITQLSEVYGVDEERYNSLKDWFSVDPKLICKQRVNTTAVDTLYKHPYISSRQARIIRQQRKQKGKLTGWDDLRLLEEFTESDIYQITPYLSFE